MSDDIFVRRRIVHPEGGEKMTKEADREASDINVIVGRYLKTGQLPPGGRQPTYGDFSSFDGLHSELERINAAEADFMALPSKVRETFHNDVGEFLQYVYSPDRTRGDFEELGLAEAQLPPEVLAVRVVANENEASEDASSTSDT